MTDELTPPKVGDFVVAHWRDNLSYDFASNGNKVIRVTELGVVTESVFYSGITFYPFADYRFWPDPYYGRQESSE